MRAAACLAPVIPAAGSQGLGARRGCRGGRDGGTLAAGRLGVRQLLLARTGRSSRLSQENKQENTQITVCPRGPLLVRGDFEILDADGEVIEPRRGTVALCRCGGSAIKPFCDGTHKLNRFEQR